MEALGNRTLFLLDRLSGSAADAKLLYQLRNAIKERRLRRDLPDWVEPLLADGANPNAKSKFFDKRTAVDMALQIGVPITDRLLAAGGKPTEAGILRLNRLAKHHLDILFYDGDNLEPENFVFEYAQAAIACISATPDNPTWHRLIKPSSTHELSLIGQLDQAHNGLREHLEVSRAAMGLPGTRLPAFPVKQKEKDLALIRTVQHLEYDCLDPISPAERLPRIKALLASGANPKAFVARGRFYDKTSAIAEAIHALDRAAVTLFLEVGAIASQTDMARVFQLRLQNTDLSIDEISSEGYSFESGGERAVFIELVALCCPTDFNWNFDFKTENWEGDDYKLNMKKVMGPHIGAWESKKQRDNLESRTAPAKASTRLAVRL